MSKSVKPIQQLLFACMCLLAGANGAASQYVEAVVIIDPLKGTATVEGNWGRGVEPRRNLSFLRSAIGAADLGIRISGVSLAGADGQPVSHRRFDPAEYVGDSAFTSFRYEVDLTPVRGQRAAAHTSWLSKDHGLIYLEDVLPLAGTGPKGAKVSVLLPAGWRRYGQAASSGAEPEKVEMVDRSVWVIGRNLIETKQEQPVSGPVVVSSGQWLFSDDEVSAMAGEIYAAYERTLGTRRSGSAVIALLPFPHPNVEKGTWEAETRGDAVVIISSDSHFKTQSLQRLHEQLRHEIFHLWLPNGVDLTGRYDWFYEGFALYYSLRTGVAVNRIRFEDMLDTLSRAHNIERLQPRRLSLIDASRERWAGEETSVYARGMLVAFICDLVLMQNSGGKKGVDVLLKQLFAAHRSGFGVSSDGNSAILKLFGSDPRLAAIANDYITGNKQIDLMPFIEAAGLEMDAGTSRSRLRIKSKLNGRQKPLLDKLGYNNWRKLSRK